MCCFCFDVPISFGTTFFSLQSNRNKQRYSNQIICVMLRNIRQWNKMHIYSGQITCVTGRMVYKHSSGDLSC